MCKNLKAEEWKIKKAIFGLLGITFLSMVFVGCANDDTETKSSSTSITETVAESSSTEESIDQYADINADLANHLAENQGWANGTIDSDGNPIENGTPNPEYAVWPVVQSVTWKGDEVQIQVTADFKSFTTEKKDQVASSAQGMAMAYADITSRPFVSVYNGEDSYGSSKATAPDEYKWN